MLAALLTVGLVLWWTVLGIAVLSGLKTGVTAGRQLLLAPTIGAAVCVLPIFWVSWWGVPVRHFAWPLLAGLTVMAIAVLLIRRPAIARRDVLHAALPLGAAFLLNGWPLLTMGFDWLSYSNDDMATYCLMASRLMDHGLVEPPSAAVIQASSDLSATMWLFESVFGRPGPHLLLAWVASLVPKSVVEIYMPVLIAMHVALVAAAGALVWREPAHRRAAFITCWLLAASALTALGTVTQLYPQVFGLALACAFLALTWDIDRPPFGLGLGRAVAAAIAGATFAIVYPEFAPFVAVPWVARLLALRIWQRRDALWIVGAVVVCGLLMTAPYVERFIPFLLNQSAQGLYSVKGIELFPYFRFSTTFANLWGLLPIARLVREPLLSITIVAGALGFAAICVGLIRPLRRGEAAPAMLPFMLLFSLLLFERGNGFGLFKLAMYAQPFMLGTVALLLVPGPASPRPFGRWMAIVLIAAVGLPSQILYLLSSVDPAHARTEIQDQRSAMHDLRALRDVRGPSLEVDLPVTVTAKLAALFLPGVPLRFMGLPERFRHRGNPATVPKRFVAEATVLRDVVVNATGTRREFALLDPAQPAKAYPFFLEPARVGSGSAACDRLLTSTGGQTIVNRTTTGATPGTLRVLPCADVANHLAFVSSTLGRNYYLAGIDPIALFGLERDYFFPDRTFAGVGRYLLFEVVHPSPQSRLLLDLTTTLKADGANRLPPVDVIGEARLPLHAVGRGAARLYSPPVAPQWIDGHAYIAIDFGTEGTLYPDPRRGLMTWLGRDIPLDARRMVGLARNISLVSDNDYAHMTPPSRIERLPQDLSAPALEYSGLYEDGWVAEDAVVVLGRPPAGGMLRVKGTLLPTASGAGMTIAIAIDGVPTASQPHQPGPFVVEIPVPRGDRDRIAVRLTFSDVRPLSDRDRRPASARLDYLGVD